MTVPKVFVNYRNEDGSYAAAYVYAALSRRFGKERVFQSSSSIAPGDHYPTALLENAAECDVMLTLIGPKWLSIVDEGGVPKICRQEDWVRREIVTALHKGRRVIPVLLAGATVPKEHELPDDLKPLATCQYRHLNYRDAEHDIQRLAQDLAHYVGDLTPEDQSGIVSNLKVTDLEGRAVGVRAPAGIRGQVRSKTDIEHVRSGGEVIGVDLREEHP